VRKGRRTLFGGTPGAIFQPLFFSTSISLFLGFLKLMCGKIRTQCKGHFVSWAIALEKTSFWYLTFCALKTISMKRFRILICFDVI
jgi:hypothetical protein